METDRELVILVSLIAAGAAIFGTIVGGVVPSLVEYWLDGRRRKARGRATLAIVMTNFAWVTAAFAGMIKEIENDQKLTFEGELEDLLRVRSLATVNHVSDIASELSDVLTSQELFTVVSETHAAHLGFLTAFRHASQDIPNETGAHEEFLGSLMEHRTRLQAVQEQLVRRYAD